MSPKRRSEKKPEQLPTFFIDDNISPALAVALRAAGVNAEHFFDHFERGTPDAEWLVDVGAREWFVLTRDARQRTRDAEIAAIKRAGVGQFVLRGQSIAGDAIVQIYVDAVPGMLRRVSANRPPFVFYLNAEGAFTVKLRGGRIPAKHRRWKSKPL